VLFGSGYLDYMGFTLEVVRASPYLTAHEKHEVLGLNVSRLLHDLTS